MSFVSLPSSAAWSHRGARSGFEVAFFRGRSDGYHITGCTTATEDGRSWIVDYSLLVDRDWRTRTARVATSADGGSRVVELHASDSGGWTMNGRPMPHLDGCRDVDLESSAMTNVLPVRRHALEGIDEFEAPAVYVRAPDLGVERLEQHYTRDRGRRAQHRAFRYTAPDLGFSALLVYDNAGLIVSYPGIAVRADPQQQHHRAVGHDAEAEDMYLVVQTIYATLRRDGVCWAMTADLRISAAEWRICARLAARLLGRRIRTVEGLGEVRAWLPERLTGGEARQQRDADRSPPPDAPNPRGRSTRPGHAF